MMMMMMIRREVVVVQVLHQMKKKNQLTLTNLNHQNRSMLLHQINAHIIIINDNKRPSRFFFCTFIFKFQLISFQINHMPIKYINPFYQLDFNYFRRHMLT